MNHYDVRVQSAQDGTKLLPLLRRSFPMAPEWELLKSLKTRDVKVDGRRVTQNETVSAGQIVEWYTMWAAQEIPVVYEDGNLLILAKPAGLNTDGHATGIMTLLAWAEARAAGERDPYRPRLVHRLDNQTYGLIMLAKMIRRRKR